MTLSQRLERILTKQRLETVSKLGRGYCSEVYLVQNDRKKKFALKIERDDSPRREFVRKESEFLQAANQVRVGPKLVKTDFENQAVLMEFIDGKPFYEWLFEPKRTKIQVKKTVKALLAQAKRLDSIGLDHGQLAGKGKNILVKKNGSPVIIDFEKASLVRKPHNATTLQSFLFQNPNSAIAKKIRKMTGQKRIAGKKRKKNRKK